MILVKGTGQPELSNNEQTRKNNTAAADALRATRTADVGGTTFGKNRKETNGANMSWWQRLNAHAANAADETFGTYSPGNALGRSKVGNTVASGLQDSGSAFSELIGFLTDQKTDKGLSEADMAFGSLGRNNIAKTDENGKLIAPTKENPAPKSVQKFWQGISDAAYKQSDKLAQESQESRIMAKDGAGTLGSVLVDVGSAGTQMAADIALGRLTGGGLAPLAARATGSAMREARQSGASRQEQFDYAISSAAVEVLTEKIGSVALPFKSVYGKGAIDDVVRDLIKKSAKTPLGRAALSTLAAAVSEGGEEVISDLINPILKKATYDKDALKEYGTDEYWSNLLYDGVIGAALGTVGSGGQVISAVGETSRNANAKKTESKQSVQPPAQPVDASQVIADMVTGKTGTRSDTAGQNTPQGGTQVNIDNAARPAYTGDSNINGGAQNVSGRSFENVSGRSLDADSDGISGVYAERDTDYQRQRGFDSVPVASGFVLSAQAQNAIRSRGVDVVETKDVSANSAAFSAALDESTIVNTDPSKHTAVEQRVIDEYQAAVDEGLTKFVSDVTSKRITKQNARYELKPVSDRAAKEIKRITGVDVSGNKTVIEARQVEHIIKRHGKNGNADKSMRDMNDLGRIQYVLDNYDSVSDGGTAGSYVTVKPNGKHGRARTVVFEKAVNGTYYVIEAVPDTAKKTTYIVSAYMSKSGAKKQPPRPSLAIMP